MVETGEQMMGNSRGATQAGRQALKLIIMGIDYELLTRCYCVM